MDVKGYKKHKKLIEAWSEGAVIEFSTGQSFWQQKAFPMWSANCTYRIKPEAKKIAGWVNIYPSGPSTKIHYSQEDARNAFALSEKRIACVEITPIEYEDGDGL